MPGFDEGQHPRSGDGKFTSGSGGLKKAAANAGARRAAAVRDAAKAGARVSRGRKPMSKDQAIDRAFLHVARGEHDKAHALFSEHGLEVPHNVKLIGKVAGYDYDKHQPAKAKPAPKEAAPKAAAKAKTDPREGAESSAKGAAKEESKPVVTPDLRDAIADRSALSGLTFDHAGAASYTPAAQAAVRGHFDAVASKYGVTKRDLPDGGKLDVVDKRSLGGAAAQFHDDGTIRIPTGTAQNLARHGEADLGNHPAYFTDAVQSYHFVTHETMHGHGPEIPYEGHGILADELATEVTARRMTADVHGIRSTASGLVYKDSGAVGGSKDLGAYAKDVGGVVNAVSRVSGLDKERAFEALERASFDVKRMPGSHQFDTGDAAMSHLVQRIASHAGISDPKKVAQLHGHVMDVSHDLLGTRQESGKST